MLICIIEYINKCMEVSANEKDVIYSCQHAVPAFISRLRQRQTGSASTCRRQGVACGSIIVEYPENASALHAVETGEADYAICGNLTTAYYMTHTDDDNCLQVVGHSERQDDLVVYAEKGNEELIKKFNVALSDYKKSGEYKRLIKFYFGDIEKQS